MSESPADNIWHLPGLMRSDFDPQMVENIFEMICISAAVKNHTLQTSPFGPEKKNRGDRHTGG